MIELASVDLPERRLTTTDGLVLAITDIFDGRGVATRNYKAAVACIADNNGSPMYVALCPFDRRALH